MYLLYNLLLWLATIIIVPYHLYRSWQRNRPAALSPRFGWLKPADIAKIEGNETIWVHAVSVGETIAVKPLLQALKNKYPAKKIVLSNVTETGRGVAGSIPTVDLCIYFPFDYAFAVRRLLKTVRPSMIIVVETEIWPNFLRCARQLEIPALIVNGRISDRSFGRYLRLSWFFRPVLANCAAFCMQTVEDARRLREIGADPAHLHVSHNLKYDLPLPLLTSGDRELLRNDYHIPNGMLVITAGSTHAGEEEIIAEIYQNLTAEGYNCFLVLTPRHPERAGRVGELLRGCGVPFALRSELGSRIEPFRSGEALLVDTVGELNRLYSLSDLVFVGGSLVPAGGHNILEPAAFGLPVTFGPHMENFREIATLILNSGGGVEVHNSKELAATMRGWLADSELRGAIGRKGRQILEENSGATERHMEIISGFLD